MTQQQPRPRFLSAPSRIFFALSDLFFGILPALAFFAWIERNSSLPFVGIEWGWPWVSLQTYSAPVLAAFNLSLFLLFGVIHSLFAQPFMTRILEKLVPPQAVRAVYMMITGLSAVAVMGLWQNTGVMLWVAPLSWTLLNAVSLLLFWGLLGLAAWTVKDAFDALEFVGLKQLYRRSDEVIRAEGTPRLVTSGIYSRVRHPIYLFTLLAVLLTPMMSLDRMLLWAAMALYLRVAVPIEERKLVAIFGPAYEEYRSRVPAILMRL